MRYDWLLEPVSEAEPCGPDLDDVGDDKYLNYVLSVSSRIPDRFYRADTGKPFDRDRDQAQGRARHHRRRCSRRRRDLRLLCIEARFQSFAGELPAFADCLEAIAGLVERFWSDVHPKAFEGDFTLRQNGLSGLDDWSAGHPAAAACDAGARPAARRDHAAAVRGRNRRRREARRRDDPRGRRDPEVDCGGRKPGLVRPQLRRSDARRGGAVEDARQLHREFRLRLRSELRSPDRLLRAAAGAVPRGAARAGGLGARRPSRRLPPKTPRRRPTAHAGGAAARRSRPQGLVAQPCRCRRGAAGRRRVFRRARAVDAGADPHPPGAHAGREATDTCVWKFCYQKPHRAP